MLVYFRLRNYALEAFQFHLMVNSIATPRVADQLKWSQVVNLHGRTGRNIQVDLHNEHLNQRLKEKNLLESAVVQ